MVRTARYSAELFVDAAMTLVAEHGPAAASLQAIARKVGAPTGSIYHRFESRSAILGTAWNQAYGGFVARLAPLLRQGRMREAALAILPWAAEDPRRARFLLLHEPVELFEDTPPPAPLRAALERLEAELDGAFRQGLALRRGGDALAEAGLAEEDLARARFLVFDGPIALLRPALLAGGGLPPHLGAMIHELHGGVALLAGAVPAAAPRAATLRIA
ncbi:TetR/AcrR family transcriptional regulator [Pseudoroseomonas cervicalis]|uniref:TetR/AcrR family transcriptional regulator n=1 Tax=Teichococcus cervicalis TaxID=204525 RepID=UPI0027815F3B|nr:TetR/AcrR family transcriptional regulator [Pseudoroseomonas cervicalis]MDQ1080212.1 AcrR family transcriptional regulator [Pseudoroseomonas cervicalis]